MFKLTTKDYIKILNYYEKDIPKSKGDIKRSAEDILTQKLCSCIKKVGPKTQENRSIRICTNSVVNKKGLSRGKFKCKNGRTIQLNKKLNKTIKLGSTNKFPV